MIILKSPQELQTMYRAGQIVGEVLLKLAEEVKPGITTHDLNRIAEELIRKKGGVPTFIGYRGYPKSLCTSVNDEVVHGIPGPRILKEGDIIGIDCGVTFEGFVGDSALTVPVGKISPASEKLLRVTRESLDLGLAQVVDGNRIGDIGEAVQRHAESHGYSVVRDFVGHGIGRTMHEEPAVPNFGKKESGPRIKAGMVVAIEPMVNVGGLEVEVLKDGWTVVTTDHQLSAHFEHTVACTDKGPWVLTRID